MLEKRKRVLISIIICLIFGYLIWNLISKDPNISIIVILVLVFMILIFNAFIWLPEISQLLEVNTKKYSDYAYIKNNLNYFREIINDYSIGELSFIDNYDFEYPKDLIAMLLKLELNKKIKLEDDRIIVLNEDSLKKSEKYLIDNIINGKIVLKNQYKLKDIIQEESEEDELIKSKEKVSEKMIIVVPILFVLWFIVFFNEKVMSSVYGKYLLIIGFIVMFLLIVFIVGKQTIQSSSWKITEKGKEMNLKLQGLNMLLNDFSIIDERDKEELILWEDYLIYSVMFGINNKIVDKYNNLINIKQE